MGRTGRFGLSGAVLALLLLSTSYGLPEHSRLSRQPSLMLWAWERPEDLPGLRGSVGVAFLAPSIAISGSRLAVAPRGQPLRISGNPLAAVTRIDIDSASKLSPDDRQISELAGTIARTAALPRVAGVQIDFDARTSERPLYRRLLHDPYDEWAKERDAALGATPPAADARAKPADAGVAEALALVVEGWRWTCGDGDKWPLAREAYGILHRQYPDSEWAQKTRYWYR